MVVQCSRTVVVLCVMLLLVSIHAQVRNPKTSAASVVLFCFFLFWLEWKQWWSPMIRWSELFISSKIDQEGEIIKHHFVLIHGLGHGAWCWYKIVTLLKQKGHRVAALDLTSNGINRAASHYAEPLLQYISNFDNEEKVLGLPEI